MALQHKKTKLIVAITMALFLTGCDNDNDIPTPDPTPDPTPGPGAFAKPDIYAGFPVTLKDAPGDHASSVSYSGQSARQILRMGFATLMLPGDGVKTGQAAIDELKQFTHNPNNVIDDQNIVGVVDREGFDVKQTRYNELATGANLIAKMASAKQLSDAMPGITGTFDHVLIGVPGNKTPSEAVELWIKNYGVSSTASQAAGAEGLSPYIDMVTGYDYRQLLLKYMLTGLYFSQSVDKYLDEYIRVPGKKDNSTAYKDGKHYTGKEHSWDEAFGYFGASANFALVDPAKNRRINGRHADVFTYADWDKDGKVSLLTEYPTGPAHFTSLFDTVVPPGGSVPVTTYSKDIMDAFITGRTLISNAVDDNGHARNLTDAERTELVAQANIITLNWEKVNAEAAHRYAGLAHQDAVRLALGVGTDIVRGVAQKGDGSPAHMLTAKLRYYKFWGELKGFTLGMQNGGEHAKMNKTEYMALFALIGYGPVLLDGSRVNGVDANGRFTMSAALTAADGRAALQAYTENLKAVQQRLQAFYGIKAQQHFIN